MKFTKRITSLLLVFVLASASLFTYVQAADFSDVPETSQYYNAINELVASGIINGYEDGTFKPDNTITRAEFSKLLAVSSAPMGYLFTANATTFSDIPDMNADHGWAVPYITYAVSTKAVNGYTDGTFRPGNPVTYGEAIKMIVCTLGYGPVADTTLTPWYQGYLNIAQQIGLNKGAASTGDALAPRGIIAQLISNMLDCPPLIQTGIDQNGKPIYSTGNNSSFGDNKDNATSDEGILIGVTGYSLDGAVVGKNKVRILSNGNTVTYSLASGLSTDSLKAYVGYGVSYSYSGTSSNKEIIKVSPISSYNSEVTVTPDQIETLSGNLLEYYVDETAERKDDKTKISYSYPYVVYNGVPVNPTWITNNAPSDWTSFASTYLNLSTFDTGSIKLLSNDGSESSAEVLFVEKYETYFVNSPSTSNGDVTIYDKNTAVTGLPNLVIDEDDVTDITKVSSKGGKPSVAALSAIQNKSVVSIAVPYGAPVGQTIDDTKIIISTATVTGDVTQLASDYSEITIASGKYELSPYYERLLASNPTLYGFTTGDNAKFYLDYLGRIVFMEKNETSDPYGLIIAYNTSTGIDGATKVKILTTSNSKIDYGLKTTLNVDGTSMSADSAITALQAKRTVNDPLNPNVLAVPVIYKVSGGEISSIQTLDTSANNHIAKDSLVYATSGLSFKTSGGATKFSMLTSGSSKTDVFVVPNEKGSFNDYTKKSASYFTDGRTYSVAAYEMNGTANARIVICYLTGGQTTTTEIVPSTPVYVVESISEINEGAQKISGKNMFTGAEFSTDTNTEEAVISIASSLQIGDLIRFVTEDGKICDIDRVYTSGQLFTYAGEVPASPIYYVKNNSGSDPDYYQVIYGTVDSYDEGGNQIIVIPEIYSSTALDETKRMSLSTSSATKYYRCYTINSNTKVEGSSIGALNTYNNLKDNAPENASKVVVIVARDVVQAVYIEQR